MADILDRDILWNVMLRAPSIALRFLDEDLRVCSVCDELVFLTSPTVIDSPIGHRSTCRGLVVWDIIENANGEPARNSSAFFNGLLRPARTVYTGLRLTVKKCVACNSFVDTGDPEHVDDNAIRLGHSSGCWTLGVFALLTGVTPPPGGGGGGAPFVSADTTLTTADTTALTADYMFGTPITLTADTTAIKADTTAVTADAT